VRGRWWIVVLGAVAGCADILGIDDGIPRTADAGVDATVDAAADAQADSSAEDNFSPLHCGSAVCDFGAGQSCCWDGDGGFFCASSPSQCGGIDIPCDRAEQCAQDAGPAVCCATYASVEGGAVATSVSCLGATLCNSGSSRLILCGNDSGADCQGDASCGASTFTLPTFDICK
jgi:hypothetical protein